MHLKVIVSITQPSKSPGWDGMGCIERGCMHSAAAGWEGLSERRLSEDEGRKEERSISAWINIRHYRVSCWETFTYDVCTGKGSYKGKDCLKVELGGLA